MRITADPEVCIASGMCALSLPDVFDQDEEDGTVVLLTATPPAEVEEEARRSVRLCPSGALRVAP